MHYFTNGRGIVSLYSSPNAPKKIEVVPVKIEKKKKIVPRQIRPSEIEVSP